MSFCLFFAHDPKVRLRRLCWFFNFCFRFSSNRHYGISSLAVKKYLKLFVKTQLIDWFKVQKILETVSSMKSIFIALFFVGFAFAELDNINFIQRHKRVSWTKDPQSPSDCSKFTKNQAIRDSRKLKNFACRFNDFRILTNFIFSEFCRKPLHQEHARIRSVPAARTKSTAISVSYCWYDRLKSRGSS